MLFAIYRVSEMLWSLFEFYRFFAYRDNCGGGFWRFLGDDVVSSRSALTSYFQRFVICRPCTSTLTHAQCENDPSTNFPNITLSNMHVFIDFFSLHLTMLVYVRK